ncbi:LytR/AlgR family response regulator transcription factor [Hymenobacter sediminicola]|uniref:Response regulator n=1 Tax=Hymenobacter sediminicola TaxID=2761579 RepID=A0A7G7WA13_9BACT|nr:response regulator [Hymenobacter sediminicola]QNH63206.1 response regulator [Hymenobacter sediminicola]
MPAPAIAASATVPRLTCAILDDDDINRLTLEHYIALTGELELVATLSGSVEGLEFFSTERRVDVLFLDVEMPDLNGLDMLRLLPEPPQVVLTTAHEDFAWDAFELRIVDYLVKPFSYERFGQAVQRVAERLHPAPTTPAQ